MLDDAIRYPWTGEQNVETILVGGVLSLLGVFFVPTLLVYGYLVRVVRQVAAGDDAKPPTFDEWADLLVDGVVAFAISLVYFLVPALVITVAAVAWIVPVSVGTGIGGSGGNSLAVVGVLLAVATGVVALLALVAAFYLFPAAIAVYARTGSVRAAFSPAVLRAVGTTDTYATAWVVALVIALVAQIVGGAIALTVIGLILVPFVGFYGNVAAAYAIGRGIRETDLPGEPLDDTAAGQPAV
ncbi:MULTISPECIES: DUF4013 domain-containing protein [Haloarcula]|uniref:DUF4013 domain-containing protein n=1 Tax=Haloarcula TaxID=2237 RepID=UPI0023EC85EF|nr:DUF4013 domain-containing protein [Halomicroarcula sp. XH51]